MDIIVRGGENITNLDRLEGLSSEEEYWIWRGQGEPQTTPGDRVYFYNDGAIVGYCIYKGFEYRESRNLDGELQSGKAILLRGPFYTCPQPLDVRLTGPWRWRYVDRVKDLRQCLDRSCQGK